MKKCLVLSENTYTPSATVRTLYRNIGAMEVARRFRQQGVQTNHIEWFGSWPHSELLKAIDSWFADSDKQYIAISVTFSLDNIILIRPVLDDIRKKYPDVQIIVGGNRNHDARVESFVDYVFLGRSMEMLDHWINDGDMHQFATDNPKVLINHKIKFDYDIPVIPELHEQDLLTEKDILGFEIGIGCKFNCSFCSYPLRGTKDPLLVEAEPLREFLQSAYDKFGVHNFYIADDTLNEQDHKLEILATAMEQLTYKPNIVAYFRLDLLNSKPQQFELLKRCQLRGLNLGIETLTPLAAKTIRKSSNIKPLLESLTKVRLITPESFISTGMIVGLTGDTEDKCKGNIRYLYNNKLVHSISAYNLTIANSESGVYEDSYLSEFGKNPERFGYKLTGTTGKEGHYDTLYEWKNDWCDNQKALDITNDIVLELQQNNIPTVTAFEWLVLLAMGVVTDINEYQQASKGNVWGVVEKRIIKHKQKYINNKLEQMIK